MERRSEPRQTDGLCQGRLEDAAVTAIAQEMMLIPFAPFLVLSFLPLKCTCILVPLIFIYVYVPFLSRRQIWSFCRRGPLLLSSHCPGAIRCIRTAARLIGLWSGGLKGNLPNIDSLQASDLYKNGLRVKSACQIMLWYGLCCCSAFLCGGFKKIRALNTRNRLD